MDYYTYMLTNPNRTVLYTSTTNKLQRRIVEHYLEKGSPVTFAGRYYCYCLVWYESFESMYQAIQYEKYIKGKSREWKERLIEKTNPEWHCLNKQVLGEWPPNKTLPEE